MLFKGHLCPISGLVHFSCRSLGCNPAAPSLVHIAVSFLQIGVTETDRQG